MKSALEELITELRDRHAPDPRMAVFEVEAAEEEGAFVLRGCTSDAGAAEELHRRAAQLEGGPVRDEVVRLPLAAHPHQAVARAAIAPLLSGPGVSHPQVSQFVLGHRATILRSRGPWLQVRGEDGYIGWTHRGYVAELDESEARAWQLGAGGQMTIALRGAVLNEEGEPLVRLPFGARVRRVGGQLGQLPDGRSGRLEGEFVEELEREARFPPHGEAVVRSALRWLGAPYLWGGVTEGGVDCSGFVQRIFALHGVALPRDADLQSRRAGQVVGNGDLGALVPGDLLFFREVPDRITHVAISMGGGEVVHASLSHGGVVRSHLLGARGTDGVLAGLLDLVVRPDGLL